LCLSLSSNSCVVSNAPLEILLYFQFIYEWHACMYMFQISFCSKDALYARASMQVPYTFLLLFEEEDRTYSVLRS
jgi:hypothetical protein